MRHTFGLVLVLPLTQDGPIGVAFWIDHPRLRWWPASRQTHEELWAILEQHVFGDADEDEAA